MCGIAGFIDFKKKANSEDLVRITDLISYRGPDDKGYHFEEYPDYNVGLGHRRLSVLDLSERGHQPMRYQNLSIIYNGEIYNFREIQKRLIDAGYAFDSDTDTEVILKAYHKWGIDALHEFNGMFVMAIFNHDTKKLFLCRDRIGVKPLFYYFKDQVLIFSSELKPILEFPGIEKEIDYSALNLFLYHGYISSPKSILKNVKKLSPGSYLIAEEGIIKVNTYWSLKEKFLNRKINKDISLSEAKGKLDNLVTSSVKYRMISDAPIGAFLSGGFDSSLITAVMQKLSAKPIKTFTIGFQNPHFNEASHAKEIANYLKTDHHELYLPVERLIDMVERIPLFFDEPFADSSQIPTMLVSEFARENVKVILSGDGGDELFCGYNNYAIDKAYQKFKPISALLNKLNHAVPVQNWASDINSKYEKYFLINKNENIINLGYLRAQRHLENLIKDIPYHLDDNYFQAAKLSENIQEAHMLQDMLLYLPDDIMVKVDRSTMSASLEGREPLLDYRIFEFSFTLPHNLKCRNGEQKYLLKQLSYDYIPEKLLNRPKQGFAVPINYWLKNELKDLVNEYLSPEFIEKQNIFTYPTLAKILDHFKKENDNGIYTRYIWHLLVFQMWFLRYMK